MMVLLACSIQVWLIFKLMVALHAGSFQILLNSVSFASSLTVMWLPASWDWILVGGHGA
jgi:hypothetical protein